MLNGGHATSGAFCGALTSSTLATITGAELGMAATAVGALYGAGAALLPDYDADGSTAYRSIGRITNLLGELLQALARFTYRRTRLPHDPSGDGEHRGLLHTFAFAVVSGLSVGLVSLVSSWAFAATMVLVLAPGIGSLSRSGPALTRRWVARRLRTHRDVNALATALLIVAAFELSGALAGLGWYAAAATAVGMLVHSGGDSATNTGVPFWWPMVTKCRRCADRERVCRGARWRRRHLIPECLRWSVGTSRGAIVERGLEVVFLVGTVALLWPDILALCRELLVLMHMLV